MIKSQVVLGVFFIIGGVILLYMSEIDKDPISGIIIIIIGMLLIIFKDEENKIEKIKEVNKK